MNKMNYLQIMLSAFARPGLAIHGCFAAALAVTVKDLVDRRVLLRAPFFEPDLSVGLPVACVLPSGRTRLLDALQAHCHHPELLSGPFRVLGSITLWDLGSVELAQTKEIRQRAVTLADAFDARQPEDAAAALWTGTAEVFEDASDYLSHLLVRSAIIPTPTGKWGGATTVRDAESSSRARDQLLQFLSGLGSSPVFEFDRPAQDLLLSMPPYPLPMWRHKRVLTAKLSAVLAAGRCALLGGSAIITAGEVETARKLVFSSVASTPEPQEQKQEEDDLYRRLQQSFPGNEPREIPMAEIQTKVRRSRRKGSKPVATLLYGLRRRGVIRIVDRARRGPTNGRAARSVILQTTRLYIDGPHREPEQVIAAEISPLPGPGADVMADVRERARITLTYRSAATGCVTSLVPCIELAYPSSGLFGPPSVSIVLHAIDSNGVTVAAPAASLQVDPTTGEIHVNRGQALKIPLRIQKKFEGDITVQAVDLSSGIAYATLKLTTDFHH